MEKKVIFMLERQTQKLVYVAQPMSKEHLEKHLAIHQPSLSSAKQHCSEILEFKL